MINLRCLPTLSEQEIALFKLDALQQSILDWNRALCVNSPSEDPIFPLLKYLEQWYKLHQIWHQLNKLKKNHLKQHQETIFINEVAFIEAINQYFIELNTENIQRKIYYIHERIQESPKCYWIKYINSYRLHTLLNFWWRLQKKPKLSELPLVERTFEDGSLQAQLIEQEIYLINGYESKYAPPTRPRFAKLFPGAEIRFQWLANVNRSLLLWNCRHRTLYCSKIRYSTTQWLHHPILPNGIDLLNQLLNENKRVCQFLNKLSRFFQKETYQLILNDQDQIQKKMQLLMQEISDAVSYGVLLVTEAEGKEKELIKSRLKKIGHLLQNIPGEIKEYSWFDPIFSNINIQLSNQKFLIDSKQKCIKTEEVNQIHSIEILSHKFQTTHLIHLILTDSKKYMLWLDEFKVLYFHAIKQKPDGEDKRILEIILRSLWLYALKAIQMITSDQMYPVWACIQYLSKLLVDCMPIIFNEPCQDLLEWEKRIDIKKQKNSLIIRASLQIPENITALEKLLKKSDQRAPLAITVKKMMNDIFCNTHQDNPEKIIKNQYTMEYHHV